MLYNEDDDYEFVESFVDSDPSMSEDEKTEFMESFYTGIADLPEDDDD